MLARASESTAPPLNRPADLASRTTPLARAPFGMATLPPISTGEATVAAKCWPLAAVLELSASARTTETVVAAGTTSGFGARACLTADFPEEAALPPGASLEAESGAEAWSADFWQPG